MSGNWFDVLKNQGLHENHDVTFLTDGGKELRSLTGMVAPDTQQKTAPKPEQTRPLSPADILGNSTMLRKNTPQDSFLCRWTETPDVASGP